MLIAPPKPPEKHGTHSPEYDSKNQASEQEIYNDSSEQLIPKSQKRNYNQTQGISNDGTVSNHRFYKKRILSKLRGVFSPSRSTKSSVEDELADFQAHEQEEREEREKFLRGDEDDEEEHDEHESRTENDDQESDV